MSAKKNQTNISLNFPKTSNYLQHQHQILEQSMESSSMMENSIIHASNSINQTKFQFDLVIQKVELQAPQPITIFVQLLKGTNHVNTKKKLKVDQLNRVASFNEKLSLVTQLQKVIGEESIGYQPKLVQLRLIALNNSKEKAIGICSIDLSTFVNQGMQKFSQKLMFQKCFDRNASISLEVRYKEQYQAITESISEETDQSHQQEEETLMMIDSQRSMNTPVHVNIDSIEDEEPILEQQDSLSDFAAQSSITKSSPYIKTFDNSSTIKNQTLHKPKLSQGTSLNSARILTSSASALSLTKTPSQTQPQTISLQQDKRSFINSQTPTTMNSTPNASEMDRKLDDKVKKLEYEISQLKKENQEYKQKLITLEVKEERMREYELKCTEAEAYRQKSLLLDQELRHLRQEQQDFEQEKVVIIENYERKLQEMRHQMQEAQALLRKQVESQMTSVSTLPDDEDLPSQQETSNYKELYEKMVQKNKKIQEERDNQKKRSDNLEQQLMKSKEQICALVNELYSLEKEQIDS